MQFAEYLRLNAKQQTLAVIRPMAGKLFAIVVLMVFAASLLTAMALLGLQGIVTYFTAQGYSLPVISASVVGGTVLLVLVIWWYIRHKLRVLAAESAIKLAQNPVVNPLTGATTLLAEQAVGAFTAGWASSTSPAPPPGSSVSGSANDSINNSSARTDSVSNA